MYLLWQNERQQVEAFWIKRNKSTILSLVLPQMAPIDWEELIYNRTLQTFELEQQRNKWTEAQVQTGWERTPSVWSSVLRSSQASSRVLIKLALLITVRKSGQCWVKKANFAIHSLKGTQVGIHLPGSWMDILHSPRAVMLQVQRMLTPNSSIFVLLKCFSITQSSPIALYSLEMHLIRWHRLPWPDEYFTVSDHSTSTPQSHTGPDVFTPLLSCCWASGFHFKEEAETSSKGAFTNLSSKDISAVFIESMLQCSYKNLMGYLIAASAMVRKVINIQHPIFFLVMFLAIALRTLTKHKEHIS